MKPPLIFLILTERLVIRESVINPPVCRDCLPVIVARGFNVPFQPIEKRLVDNCFAEVDGLPAEGTVGRLVPNAVQALSADGVPVGADQSGRPPAPVVLVEADGALPALPQIALVPHFYFMNYTLLPGTVIIWVK